MPSGRSVAVVVHKRADDGEDGRKCEQRGAKSPSGHHQPTTPAGNQTCRPQWPLPPGVGTRRWPGRGDVRSSVCARTIAEAGSSIHHRRWTGRSIQKLVVGRRVGQKRRRTRLGSPDPPRDKRLSARLAGGTVRRNAGGARLPVISQPMQLAGVVTSYAPLSAFGREGSGGRHRRGGRAAPLGKYVRPLLLSAGSRHDRTYRSDCDIHCLSIEFYRTATKELLWEN